MGLTSDEGGVCRELDGDIEPRNRSSILLESANAFQGDLGNLRIPEHGDHPTRADRQPS